MLEEFIEFLVQREYSICGYYEGDSWEGEESYYYSLAIEEVLEEFRGYNSAGQRDE